MTLATMTTADSRKFAVLTTIPKTAMENANKSAGVRYGDAKTEYQRIMATTTAPVMGADYEVTFGDRRGVRGKLVWQGKTKWGVRYLLATSNEKLPNGRYRDSFFIRPKWVQKVDAVRDAQLKAAGSIMSDIDTFRETAYETELLRLYREAAAAWSVSESVLFKRVIEVMEERVRSINDYDKQNAETAWACDGPAYNQVQRQFEAHAREVKNYEKIVALLTKEVAKNGN